MKKIGTAESEASMREIYTAGWKIMTQITKVSLS